MKEEILQTAVRYVVMSIAVWKPEGEFAFRIGSAEKHGEDCIADNEVLTKQFSWKGLAEDIACRAREDAVEIEAALKRDSKLFLEKIKEEIIVCEGVVSNSRCKDKVSKIRGGVVIEGYFENRIGIIQRKGGLHKYLLIEAVALEIANQYKRFCKDSDLNDADCWVVGQFDEFAKYTGKILTWHEVAESAIKNSHLAFETNEVLFLIRENIADLTCVLFQSIEFSEATITYKQGILHIFPKASLHSSQMNDYLMDGMK